MLRSPDSGERRLLGRSRRAASSAARPPRAEGESLRRRMATAPRPRRGAPAQIARQRPPPRGARATGSSLVPMAVFRSSSSTRSSTRSTSASSTGGSSGRSRRSAGRTTASCPTTRSSGARSRTRSTTRSSSSRSRWRSGSRWRSSSTRRSAAATFFRSAFYFPSIASSVAITTIAIYILNANGLFNRSSAGTVWFGDPTPRSGRSSA